MIILVSGASRDVPLYPKDRVGQFITPATGTSIEGIAGSGRWWAADNGAYSRFDEPAYLRMLRRIRAVDTSRLLFVVAPDVVAQSDATVGYFDGWLDALKPGADENDHLPVAFVAQDGLEDRDWDWWFGFADCLFVGGSTEWKLSRAAADLVLEAKRRGLWVHAGRVNTMKRINHFMDLGTDSIDGTGYSRFPKHIANGVRWIGQHGRPARVAS